MEEDLVAALCWVAYAGVMAMHLKAFWSDIRKFMSFFYNNDSHVWDVNWPILKSFPERTKYNRNIVD